MAITQDELGNYYDDSDYITATDNAQPITRSMTTGIGFTGGDSFHDFNPTPIPTSSITGSDSFHDFNPTPVQTPNQNGIANYLNSVFGGANGLKTASATAGALAGAFGGVSPNSKRSGYQGSIPQLQAVRNMVTAPPTANYRPGQGGVRYNSDVYYAPKGSVPAGMTGTMTPAAQVAASNAARAAAAPKSNSTLSNLAKVAGGAGIASLLSNVLGGKSGSTGATNKTLAGLVDAGGRLTTAGINALTNAFKTATAGGTPAGSRPGGVVPKTGTPAGGTPAGGAPSTTGDVAADDGTTDGIQATIDEMNANPYNADGTLKEGYELDEDNNPVLSGDNTVTVYNPDGSSYIMGRDNPQVLSDAEIEAEYERLAAERAAEIEALEAEEAAGISADPDQGLSRSMGGGNAAVNVDDYYDPTNDMSNTDYSGFDYSGFDFGSNDLDLSEFNFGGDGYDGIDYGEYFAKGGAINMAKGRYLRGNTDGMADKLPAKIGQKQPAALSHGEFVVPADVVSHLGNGNSDAGAKKLYQMMDKIRVARTGNKKQGKQINPDKFMPGGLAKAYAQGGSVKHFVTGGTTGNPTKDLSGIASAGITGSETSPNTWAGGYMSDLLGKTQALTESPYQQYMGPLTAGASGLQDKMFTGLQNTAFPSNLGQTFSSQGAYQAPSLNMDSYQTQPIGSTMPTTPMAAPNQSQGIASQYMNPYLQSVLQPQLAELRRTSQINMQPGLAKLTQAGGYGGSRQAIMESEANRNLLQQQNQAIGAGYANAYDKAQQQFNTEQTQGRSLADLIGQQGNVQRGIEAEGIAADKSAFEEARENPYKMLQFQQAMLNGMPISATSYDIAEPSKLVSASQGAVTVNSLLKNLGLI